MNRNEKPDYIFISPSDSDSPKLDLKPYIRHEVVSVGKLESLSNSRLNGIVVVISSSCGVLHCEMISNRLKSLNGHGPKQIINMSASKLSCNSNQIRDASQVAKILHVLIKK